MSTVHGIISMNFMLLVMRTHGRVLREGERMPDLASTQPLLWPWRRIGLEGTRTKGRENGGVLSQNTTSKVKGMELEISVQ